MKINLDNNGLSADVDSMLNAMKNVCEKEQKSFLRNLGEIVTKSVKKNMVWRSGINKSDYVHMQDGIETVVKKDKYGKMYVRIQGGKGTGHKWRFLNDGAIDNKGNVLVEATHFVEKSITDSQSEVDAEADKLIERIVNSDGK